MLHLFTFNKVVVLFTYPLTHLNGATFHLRIKVVLKVWWGLLKNSFQLPGDPTNTCNWFFMAFVLYAWLYLRFTKLLKAFKI